MRLTSWLCLAFVLGIIFILIPILGFWIFCFGSVIVAFTMNRTWFEPIIEKWMSFWTGPIKNPAEYEMAAPMTDSSDPEDHMPSSLDGLIPAIDQDTRYKMLPDIIRDLVLQGHTIIEIEVNPQQAVRLANDLEYAIENREPNQ